ncbi:amidohydrolase [Streptomyces sp. NPDC048419]|uniref:amidohydrolase n=1 Tax=Streptomyces sp. NPDC048419 TaxID=3365547 RepID=UPI003713C939
MDEELEGCSTDVIHDLQGAPVVPGLHDAHCHISMYGQELTRLDVSPNAAATLDELYALVAQRAAERPVEGWVLGWGYDALQLGRHPDPDALDRASGGRAVWLVQASRHGGVASRSALRRMGLDRVDRIPVIDGGYIGLGSDGRPDGLIAEQAMALVNDHIRPIPFEEYVEAIGLAAGMAAAAGLTSVTEPGIAGRLTGNAASDLAAFQAARDRGLLDLRVTVMPEISALHELIGDAPGGAGYGLSLGLRTGLGDDWLRIGGVKAFSDGAITMRTAALCCDYTDAPGQRGCLVPDSKTLRRQILKAAAAGWQVATHAIGDLAVETVLSAYEETRIASPQNRMRHRIEHIGLATDAQIKRLRIANVVPVPQGRFLDDFGHNYLTALGEERAQFLFRQRGFLDGGLELPGSSDCPIVSGSPLLGLHSLVNREIPGFGVLNPAERLTPAQALRAFTYGSAYADHQEHRKGNLARGKLADFVVLTDDPLEIAPDRLGSIGVVATVVGGHLRHGELASR